jgi:hypothetical protein
MSASYGCIKRVSESIKSQNNKTVIFIQDIHLNSEAQENISHVLKFLIENKKIDIVALEGAFQPISYLKLSQFPYQASVKAVADYLIEKKKISGSVYSGFLANPASLPDFVGVDDLLAYEANVKAFQDSNLLQPDIKTKIELQKMAINKQKEMLFNSDLLEFDRLNGQFKDQAISMGDYLEQLENKNNFYSPHLKLYLSAWKIEKALDFKKIDQEKNALFKNLMSKLDNLESSQLLAHASNYRLGNINHEDFYSFLKNLCELHGTNFNLQSHFNSYVQYLSLSASINSEELFRDLAKLEKNLFASMARTSIEKDLVRKSEKLYLTTKLLNFSLSSTDWQNYKKNKSEFTDEGLGLNLKPFEEFYDLAEKRDSKMAENLIQAMEKKKSNTAVLVAGGFHSEGIVNTLNRQGISMVLFSPQLSKVDEVSGGGYLSVFNQEKTPLDKLFQGEKLFLSPKQIQDPALVLPFAAAHHLVENPGDKFEVEHSIPGSGGSVTRA